MIAGLSRFRTNVQAYAKFYLLRYDFYVLVIRYPSHEEVFL